MIRPILAVESPKHSAATWKREWRSAVARVSPSATVTGVWPHAGTHSCLRPTPGLGHARPEP